MCLTYKTLQTDWMKANKQGRRRKYSDLLLQSNYQDCNIYLSVEDALYGSLAIDNNDWECLRFTGRTMCYIQRQDTIICILYVDFITTLSHLSAP